MGRRVSGARPLSYLGVWPTTPPNMNVPGIAPIYEPRDPRESDINHNLGDFWLNKTTRGLWYLSALGSHPVDGVNTRFATWVLLATGGDELDKLSGDAGVNPVFPDVNKNINIFGDNAVGLMVSGDGVDTLTVTTTSGNVIGETLTGDVGGAVPFDAAGNINLVSSAASGLVITGNPGTNTLTWSASGGGHFGETLTGDAGGAVSFDAAGNIDTLGAHGINTLGNPGANSMTFAINNTITLGDLAVVTTGNDALTVTSGNITLSGTGVNAAGNINIPDTSTDGRQGIIKFGGTRFISNFGVANTFVGENSGNTTLTGTTNTAVGFEAGLTWTTAAGATAVGHMALRNNTGAGGNDAFGSGALQNCTTGGSNVALGAVALQDTTTGSFNVAVGLGALNSLTTGQFNTVIGYNAGRDFETGDDNIIIGNAAGQSLDAGDSDNIFIGNNGGGPGENNTLRLGTNGNGAGQQNRCFIAGIRGITTGVADAVAVLIDSQNQLGTVSSSIRVKENVNDMGSYSEALYSLRPVTFNYKNHSSERKSVGLIAEEVAEVMPDLVVFDKDGLPETVRYLDLPILLLNELKKQHAQITQLQYHVKELERLLLQAAS